MVSVSFKEAFIVIFFIIITLQYLCSAIELTVKNRKTHPKTTHSSENIHETDIEYILDITIGYQGKYPIDLLQILNGLRGPCFTNLYYRIYECKNVSNLK